MQTKVCMLKVDQFANEMHSFTVWKSAERPNYVTNFDKLFPYSEVAYLGEHFLMKIPASLNNLIQHVDYWGEGRIVTGEGIRGFSNSYNINHQYQLVSSGPDVDKKIPNRIPVLSYSNCDTSAYIKDNSVVTVTVAGAHISNCAQDIARIVNNDHGTVVIYGERDIYDSREILDLAKKLKVKGLLACPGAALPSELQELTYYDSHVAFLNIRLQKEELYNNVIKGNYDTAVNMTKSLGEVSDGEGINEIITRLISSAPRNVMSYAYKLWDGGAEDVIRNHFPKSFQHIFNDFVTIVNKKYNQPLKLDLHIDSDGDRLAWGDNNQYKISSKSVSWKIHPMWDGDAVSFKLYNIHHGMHLKLDLNEDSNGDRQVWGSNSSNEDRRRFYLEPVVGNDDSLFFIINCTYGQALTLDVNTNNVGDRLLCGRGGAYTEHEQFRWVVAVYNFVSDTAVF